jgi:hypothetical protein
MKISILLTVIGNQSSDEIRLRPLKSREEFFNALNQLDNIERMGELKNFRRSFIEEVSPYLGCLSSVKP